MSKTGSKDVYYLNDDFVLGINQYIIRTVNVTLHINILLQICISKVKLFYLVVFENICSQVLLISIFLKRLIEFIK